MDRQGARAGSGSPTPGPSGASVAERSAATIERRRGLSEDTFLHLLFRDDCAVDTDSEGGESEGEAYDTNKQPQGDVIIDDPDDPDIVDLEGDVVISVPEEPESGGNDESESESDVYRSESSIDISLRRKRSVRYGRRVRARRQSVRSRRARRVSGDRSVGRDEGWRETEEFIPNAYLFDSDSAGLAPDAPFRPDSRESDFFLQIVDIEVAEKLVIETNRFREQLNTLHGPFSSGRMRRWRDTDIAEMYLFIALTLLMPHTPKHRVRDYWSTDSFVQTSIFRQYMTRDRYLQISRFLHFTDNDDKEARRHDRLWKIRDLLEMVRTKMIAHFHPFQKLVIDESLILFKGRLIFKQYIKTKRSRFGIKIYVLCDCQTGMVLDLIVYTGTDIDIPSNDPLGHSGAIVKRMLDPYLNKSHILYTDNFYTSPGLSEFLHLRDTGSVGTVRPNCRGMPTLPILPRGQTLRKEKGSNLALRWRDKRDITMLSTIHRGQMVNTGKVDPVTREAIVKPDCVIDYTKNMRLVDKSDMQIASVECMRRTIKWYKKLFFHLIDVALLNAFNMFKLHTGRKASLRVFSMQVVKQLVGIYGTPLDRPRPGRRGPAAAPVDRLAQAAYIREHHLVKMPRSDAGKARQRDCHVCNTTTLREKTRKRVTTWCPKCQTALCDECFVAYHTLEQY